jgi:hypothetical protein
MLDSSTRTQTITLTSKEMPTQHASYNRKNISGMFPALILTLPYVATLRMIIAKMCGRGAEQKKLYEFRTSVVAIAGARDQIN